MRYLPALLDFFGALLVWSAYWVFPVLVLIWLVVRLSLGNHQTARLQYDAAMQAAAGPHKRFTGTVYRSREATEQSIKLLAGWFLLRIGRPADAIPLLQVAARGQPRSSVNDQAERQLAAIATGAATP
jgi:hypothetical protein